MTTRNKPNIDEQSFHEKIQQELSFYIEKHVHEDGSVSDHVVNDPYFLVNNVWNVCFIGSIEEFKEQYTKYNYKKSIKFEFYSPSLNLEMKYIYYRKLFKNEWSLYSIYSGLDSFLKQLTRFINEKYPRIFSFLDLNLEKTNREWIFWLENEGKQTVRQTLNKSRNKEYNHRTPLANYLKLIYNSLSALNDTRDEWEKDKWDIRELNEKYGIHYNQSYPGHLIDFSCIKNFKIRQTVKTYFKQRLLGKHGFSWSTAKQNMKFLYHFCNFIILLEPHWNDFRNLSRLHIQKYIEWLNEYVKNNLTRKNANPESYIFESLRLVENFLIDLQIYELDIAPIKNIKTLIYQGDKPKRKKKPYDQIDYIPDYVLEQLFDNINYLHPEVQPVVSIAFKTGLRISDVLGLRQDCLVKLNGKYQIITDIEKTYVKGHSIPIDEELANLLLVLIDETKKQSNQENNPQNYIFVRYKGSRKGKTYTQEWIRAKLNTFARERNIVDENGVLFHFKTHQFRHTYAIKMLNGGADILTVQELLAHASPEMTMVYARLLDDTKRNAFEKAVNQGIFSFDLNGKIYNVSETEGIPQDVLEMLWRDQKLTAIDNPYGSCRARLNGNCPYAEEPPCLTCNGGKPCKDLAVGLSEMDAAKYEIHIQSTSKMIEVAQQYGREEILEKNQKNLERLQDIYNTIKKGNIIFGRLERMKRKQGVTNG
ncbi:tyrosine-type recombinase/integrase [Bacillus mycoides]|uniref:tyrosine-type recombinase/integrase n=1 Tax=Bacillus mycoides TaxID=1405 RepID=UPI002E1D535B|nr:tyrosine-type recombinase/integrase [Bacillus mycoides]MED1287687.1 tyrosine-type recombinase/integrase [Bacillus mycoides]